MSILGWDIGAANVKAALWIRGANPTSKMQVASQPFEIWRNRDHLAQVLRTVFDSVVESVAPRAMAVTMTAELSDAFATKREGVLYILQNLKSTFPCIPAYIFGLDGKFATLDEATRRPLDFAASNWLATAKWVSARNPNCLLVDVGSTTTDILPIINGEVDVIGRTDMERLASGELVYTGSLRTNLATVAPVIPVAGRFCRVASEYFAISGDVHLILGNLKTADYSCPTPDGRPVSDDSARKRVARIVCADTEMLTPDQIDEMVQYLSARQALQIRDGIEQVISRRPCLRGCQAIVVGSGSFLGIAAVRSAGLEIDTFADNLGSGELAVAPCLAAAQLLYEHLEPATS